MKPVDPAEAGKLIEHVPLAPVSPRPAPEPEPTQTIGRACSVRAPVARRGWQEEGRHSCKKALN